MFHNRLPEYIVKLFGTMLENLGYYIIVFQKGDELSNYVPKN